MNKEEAVKLYEKVLKEVCNTSMENMDLEFVSAAVTSKGFVRVTVENTYGQIVHEMINQSNYYNSLVEDNYRFIPFDGENDVTKEIIQNYGLALEDSLDQVIDVLENYLDWSYEKDEIPEHKASDFLSENTSLTKTEAFYLLDNYNKIPMREKMNLDPSAFVKRFL